MSWGAGSSFFSVMVTEDLRTRWLTGDASLVGRIKRTKLPADTCHMTAKPEPSPKPMRWNIEAPDEAAAIEKRAAEFNVVANRLMAIRDDRREVTGCDKIK
jgi:hypothetical protein